MAICVKCCCACCECKLSTGCTIIAIVEIVFCALLIAISFQDDSDETTNKSEFTEVVDSLNDTTVLILDIVFYVDKILILIASVLLLVAVRKSMDKMLVPYLIINGIHVAFWFLLALGSFFLYTMDVIKLKQAKGFSVLMLLIGGLNLYFELVVVSFYQFIRDQSHNQNMVLHYRGY